MAYEDRLKIVPVKIPNAKISGNNSDFVITLNETNFLALMMDAGADSALNGGGDLLFYEDLAGTIPLPVYVNHFITSSTLGNRSASVRVKRNTLNAGADRYIYCAWKKAGATLPAATSTYGRNAVFTNYISFWPLTINSTTLTGLDATGNNHSLSTQGSLSVVEGQNTYAVNLGNSDESVADPIGAMFTTDTGLNTDNAYTVGLRYRILDPEYHVRAWAKLFECGTQGASEGGIAASRNGGSTNLRHDVYNDSAGRSDIDVSWGTLDQWQSYNRTTDSSGGSSNIYNDGVLAGSINSYTRGTAAADFVLGNGSSFNRGMNLEAEYAFVYDGVQSAGSIQTEKNNHADMAAFAVFGTPQDTTSSGPVSGDIAAQLDDITLQSDNPNPYDQYFDPSVSQSWKDLIPGNTVLDLSTYANTNAGIHQFFTDAANNPGAVCLMPAGTYQITAAVARTWTNVLFACTDGVAYLTCNSSEDNCLELLDGCKNVHGYMLDFNISNTRTSVNGWGATVKMMNKKLEMVSLWKCRAHSPNSFTMGMAFSARSRWLVNDAIAHDPVTNPYVQDHHYTDGTFSTGGLATLGYIKSLYLNDCIIEDCGHIGITVYNRTSTLSDALDAFQDFHCDRTLFKHNGTVAETHGASYQAFGFGISLDGVCKDDCSVNDGVFDNLLGIGLENVGMSNISFLRNVYQNFEPGREWMPFASTAHDVFVSGDIYQDGVVVATITDFEGCINVTVEDNAVIGTANKKGNLYRLQGSHFKNNVWSYGDSSQGNYDAAFQCRDMSWNEFTNDTFTTKTRTAIELSQGSSNNKFNNITADNTQLTGANTIALFNIDSTSNNNAITGTANKAAGGSIINIGKEGLPGESGTQYNTFSAYIPSNEVTGSLSVTLDDVSAVLSGGLGNSISGVLTVELEDIVSQLSGTVIKTINGSIAAQLEDITSVLSGMVGNPGENDGIKILVNVNGRPILNSEGCPIYFTVNSE